MGVGELEQVLSNLMINALDAVDEHSGEIRVRVAPMESGMIAIEVTDNGPGVAVDDMPHIFDPFFLHQRNRSRDRPGADGGLCHGD